MIHKTNTHQTSNPLFPCFFVVIACLFSLLPKPQTHKHHTMWLWKASVKKQCVLKCKGVDHKHVWMQRESRQKGMVEGVHTNKAMAVWWLVTLLAWWWLQCVVEWMWNARECGDAHKRLIAPRCFERERKKHSVW